MNTASQTATELTTHAKQLYDCGDFEAARRAYEQALHMQRQILHQSHPNLAASLYWLGMTQLELGNHVAAEATLSEARSIEETMQPPVLTHSGRCLSGLGIARFYAGDIAGALHLTEQALAIREQTLGDDHPDTIESLNHLGIIVNRRGERARSLALHKEALARCERGVRDTHRVTGEVCSSLSIRLGANTPDARMLSERALRISEQLFGPTHPTTAQMLNNLAALVADAGDDAAAGTLLQRSLALHEERLGPQNPRLAYVLHNLAGIYKSTGEWNMAQRCNERAVIIRERVLGAQHPDTLQSVTKLVALYGDLLSKGDRSITQFSIPMYVCMTALQAAAGTLDPKNASMPGAYLDADTAAAQLHEVVGKIEDMHHRLPLTEAQQATLSQAAVLQTQADERYRAGDYTTARELLDESITLVEQIRGATHMDLVAPLNQMQQVMKALGKPTAVLPLAQRITDIHVAVLGEHHAETMLALTDLASLYSVEYGMEAAFPLFERVWKLREATLGPNEPSTQHHRTMIERWREQYGKATATEELPVSRSAKHEAAQNEQHPWIEEVLRGIDDIDWHSLHHAYGPADDVPRLLRRLASDDPDVREDVWGSLYSNIWHQGTVYEASAYAVPFLLRLLADHRTPDRMTVLGLLQSLANGNSYIDVHHREEDSVFNLRNVLADTGKDFDTELQRELRHVRAANKVVAEGAELFLQLAEDSNQDAEMRREAIETLASLPTQAELIIPRLRMLLDQPNAAPLRAGVVSALHRQMDSSPRSQRFFAALLEQEADADTAFNAATALIQRSRERAPEAAVDVVLNALKRHGDERGFGYTIFYDGTAALLVLGAERSRVALLRALPHLHNTDSDELHRLAEMLLDLVFNTGQRQHRDLTLSKDKQTKRRKIEYWGGNTTTQPERDPATLTDAQREVLIAIVAHDALWTWDSNLLTLYGLPAERESLRAWLAE